MLPGQVSLFAAFVSDMLIIKRKLVLCVSSIFSLLYNAAGSKLNNSGAPRARERSPIPKKMW